MPTQKALVVSSIGNPLTPTTRPIPQPGPHQIQLRVTVAALNPHDQKGRDYGLFTQESLPAVLANDVAGVVTSVGSSVTKFAIGDRVFTYSDITDPEHTQKGLQEYIVADEDFTAKIPEGFTDHEVATLPVNVSASLVGLFDESGLGIPPPWTREAKTFDYANTQILIIGGGSNCGRFAVQLAKLAGIGKIVVVGGKEEELKRFGATNVLDRHGGDEAVAERIRNVVGDDLLYCYDTVNPPESLYVGINALSSYLRGKVARLLPTGPPDISKIDGKKAGYEVKDVFGEPHVKSEVSKPFWDKVGDYLVKGKIMPLEHAVEEGLNAEKVNDVLDRYRDGKRVVQTHFRIAE